MSNTARHPYPAVARDGRPDTIVHVGRRRTPIGGSHVTVIAGPCAVDARGPLLTTAGALARLDVPLLRGGAFKPRTSPHSFQGLGAEGLALLAEARDATGMGVVTEVVAPEDVALVAQAADVLQVGTRNMSNFRLLEALAGCGKPVLLKRGMAATIEELLCAAEYVVHGGNPDVILCERGVRSFEPLVRASLDLSSIALLRELTHLPVVVDPSHASGRAELVHAVSMGAVAAGAQGLLVEVHERPEASVVDAAQTIGLAEAARLVDGVAAIARATGRRFVGAAPQVAA